MIKLSHSPCGAACALNTFASLALAPSCTTSNLLGALQSHTTNYNVSSFCCCRLRVDTHQMSSSKGKQLQCGQTYDNVTPPIPSTCAMIRLKKSVFFSGFPAQCPSGRCPPRPPSHKPPEAFRWSIPRAFLLSCIPP